MTLNENAEAKRIVIVDDDPDLREMVADYLGGQGFSAHGAGSGAALDRILAAQTADLLLVDLNLPDEDGFSIARRIGATMRIPIIMLTGAADVLDRIVGLEVGADDYVTKPFDLRELKARIRAVLRRNGKGAGEAGRPVAPAAQPGPAQQAHLVAFGRVHLDLDGHSLLLPDGSRDALTAMEFDLLRVLAQHPNRVLSRDRLLDLAHSRDNEPFDRSIDVRITRLRKKIETDPAKPAVIKTIRGVGYMFVPDRNGHGRYGN